MAILFCQSVASIILSKCVKTEYGKIVGLIGSKTINYLGIPYASPPVDNLRWKEPKHPQQWSKILKATKYKSACIQTQKNCKEVPYMCPLLVIMNHFNREIFLRIKHLNSNNLSIQRIAYT